MKTVFPTIFTESANMVDNVNLPPDLEQIWNDIGPQFGGGKRLIAMEAMQVLARLQQIRAKLNESNIVTFSGRSKAVKVHPLVTMEHNLTKLFVQLSKQCQLTKYYKLKPTTGPDLLTRAGRIAAGM